MAMHTERIEDSPGRVYLWESGTCAVCARWVEEANTVQCARGEAFKAAPEATERKRPGAVVIPLEGNGYACTACNGELPGATDARGEALRLDIPALAVLREQGMDAEVLAMDPGGSAFPGAVVYRVSTPGRDWHTALAGVLDAQGNASWHYWALGGPAGMASLAADGWPVCALRPHATSAGALHELVRRLVFCHALPPAGTVSVEGGAR